MADLLTVPEYKAYAGLDPSDTSDDAEISALIRSASRVIANYTERDFGAPLITESRTYSYDGSGYLDIDDCSSVASVALVVTGFDDIPLQSDEWLAMPPRRDDAPVYYYILMPGFYGGLSAEMGFTRNLDVMAREGRWRSLPTNVNVTAQWGWPAIPEDIKLATFWTMQEWRARSTSEGLASESIEGFARSWSRGEQGQEVFAVPSRARDVLAFYTKIQV